jgi:Domain of unknown function (DUF4032)
MMMIRRFVFTPPADHAAGLLTLPWAEPLEQWRDERLVEIRQPGISRHVVRLRLRTRVAESGHDSRQLFQRTGIDAGEHQARRLLNDMASFRARLEHKQGRPVSEVMAANRWLEEVYDPVINAIPEELRDRLPPAEVFHEVLEHRWYMSEAARRDVGTTTAAKDYIEHVLPAVPAPLDEATAA